MWERLALAMGFCVLALGCSVDEGHGRLPLLRQMCPAWLGAQTPGQLEVALVQEAHPSSFLTEQLWTEVDEQVVPMEMRAKFEANGLRLGLVQGAGSSKLLALLTGKDSLLKAERLTAVADKETRWPLAACTDCQLAICQRNEMHSLRLVQPEFGLAVRLAAVEHGKTLVVLEPYTKHQASNDKLLAADSTKEEWKLNGQEQPELRLPELRWQIALGPTDYLVVGCRPARAGTFGTRAFVDESKNRQQLLVIRGVGRHELTLPDGNGPVPLALQTVWNPFTGSSTPRGQSPDANESTWKP